jgi:DNA mismatch repair protein MutS2
MISITEKTLQDLHSQLYSKTISTICNTDWETKALEITPFRDKETLMQALMQTSEYVSSFQNKCDSKSWF